MSGEPVEAELGGYAEVRAVYQVGVEGVPWQLVERVRPRFTIAPTPRMSAEVVVEAGLVQGRDASGELVDTLLASPLGPALEEGGCSFYDSNSRYTSTAAYLSVERLHLDLNYPGVDLTIGRQPLRWGSGLAFHPTDLYAESLLQEPWREPRGINAVRADIPIGASQITVVGALDDDLSPLWSDPVAAPLASAATRATLRAAGTDFSAIGQVKTNGDWFGGGDLRGTLGVGWWVEGGWHGTPATDLTHSDGTVTTSTGGVEVVAGVDYSLRILSRFYLAAEYRYDGTGRAPGDYDYASRYSGDAAPFSCPFLTTSDDPARQTLGRHYVAQVTSIQFTEDFGVTNSVVVNLEDGTGLLVPDVSMLAGNHIAVHVGGQIPFGTDGEFKPAAEDLNYSVGAATADLSSLYPDATLLAWLRYSF